MLRINLPIHWLKNTCDVMVWWFHTKHCQSIYWGFEILILFDPYPDPTDQPTPILNRTGDVFVRKLLIRGLPWKKWLLQPLSNHAPKKWRGVRGLWRSTWWLQDIGNWAILKSWLGTRLRLELTELVHVGAGVKPATFPRHNMMIPWLCVWKLKNNFLFYKQAMQ